jgi:hypothetical protein
MTWGPDPQGQSGVGEERIRSSRGVELRCGLGCGPEVENFKVCHIVPGQVSTNAKQVVS